MTAEIQDEAVETPAPAPAPAARRTWREERWERRRRRVWFEEVLAWILVPVILLACYWAVVSGLDVLGTSPAALWQGIQAVIGQL